MYKRLTNEQESIVSNLTKISKIKVDKLSKEISNIVYIDKGDLYYTNGSVFVFIRGFGILDSDFDFFKLEDNEFHVFGGVEVKLNSVSDLPPYFDVIKGVMKCLNNLEPSKKGMTTFNTEYFYLLQEIKKEPVAYIVNKDGTLIHKSSKEVFMLQGTI